LYCALVIGILLGFPRAGVRDFLQAYSIHGRIHHPQTGYVAVQTAYVEAQTAYVDADALHKLGGGREYLLAF